MSGHEEGGKLIDGQALFEQRRQDSEITKMAQLYLSFQRNFEHYLVLESIPHTERVKYIRTTKAIYDRMVRKLLSENKNPSNIDFNEFLEVFNSEILITPVFTTIISTKIKELLESTFQALIEK